MRKVLKWSLRILAGLLAVLLIALSIVLSPRTLTKILNNLASSYVDGSAVVGKAGVSIIRTFPNIGVGLDSIAVTYPHGAFSYETDSFDAQFRDDAGLLNAGKGSAADTLITVNRLSARVNPFALLCRKVIRVSNVEVGGVRAFAHKYNDSTANWNVIRLPESKDTASSPLPEIEVKGININDIQALVLTCPTDTLLAGVQFSSFKLEGDFSIKDGAIAADAGLELDGGAQFTNPAIDNLDIPVAIDAAAQVRIAPEGAMEVLLKSLSARVDALPLEAGGLFQIATDSTFVKAEASIQDCPLGRLVDSYGKFMPAVLHGLKTDAVATVKASADGWFGSASGVLPAMKAEVYVPDSHIAYEGLVEEGDFDLSLIAGTDKDGMLNADLEDLCFDIKGVSLNASGTGHDILGKDPRFGVKAFACTEFADLVKYLPHDTGISAEGDVDFEIEGDFSLSQLTPQNIHLSDLNGRIFSEGVRFSITKDTLYAYVSRPDIKFSTAGQRLSAKALVDSLRFISGAATYIMGSSIALEANNHGRLISDEGKIQPMFADLDIDSFNMRGTDSLTVGIRNSCSKLTLGGFAEDGKVRSDVSVTSSNRMAYVRAGSSRITLANPEITASMRKRVQNRLRRRDRRPEGLQSSLYRMRRDSMERTIPDYLKEIDFRKRDLSIDIGESLTEMFRKWTPSAEVSFSLGSVSTPLLPLKNSITSFDATFDGDKLELDNFLINSGTTIVGFRGDVSGIEPILLGRKNAPLNAAITLHSRMLNVNELLAAIQAGNGIARKGADVDYVIEGLEDAEESLDFAAIVVPANLNADVTVDIDSVRYSKLALRDFSTHVRMRERCLQLTNTSAGSEFGKVSVDGFYSTVSKDDIKAGFDVRLSSITANRIITLFPAIDSLVPMLKSFNGDLNCEVAATTQLDTNMNVLLPSVSGAVKLNGTGLELSDTGDLRRILQLLRFKDTKIGHIDDMSVNCIIGNNQLEVFPFILGVDRYTLGLSGLQGFDQRFKYHISVIKSPLPFKFGINLKGTFDNWGFTLGRPKYKSTSIPLFSPQVDTMQINLATSIKDIFKKGVSAAVREYALERERVNGMRQEYGLYEDDEDEELSAEEIEQFDSYLLDIECEAESERIEREIAEMLDDEMMANLLSELEVK